MSIILAETAQTIYVSNGLGFGAALAIVCSWQRNRSILWAILAGFISWFYVIYFAITRRPDEVK
jgi:ABC-type Fe3+-siderophore transport system permease subunit